MEKKPLGLDDGAEVEAWWRCKGTTARVWRQGCHCHGVARPMALGKKVMCRWKRERSTGCSRPGGWRWLSQGGVDARVSGSLAEDMLRAVVDMGDGARGEGKKVELYRGIRFR